MSNDILRTNLLDLHEQLDSLGIKLLLGGGYGLFLKQMNAAVSNLAPTLIAPEYWPLARSTDDLDIFLNTEIIANVEDLSRIKSALETLGYAPLEKAKYMRTLRKKRTR